jgi:hypothetical protein
MNFFIGFVKMNYTKIEKHVIGSTALSTEYL